MQDKRKKEYNQSFLHIDSLGAQAPIPSRMWADIKAKTLELWQMGQDRVKSHFEDGKKEKGVCNNINQFFVEMMHDGNAAELPPTVAVLVDTNFEKLFNPFLKLKGFDGCKDTPVEVFHVFLLGVVKYMTQDFMKSLKHNQLAEVLCAWEAFDVGGLNIETIPVKYLSNHFKSLIGKD
ncbi:hypothetical protein PCANC_27920 [Puccinia coronata f. sp. avenae]|uniref:Uncharacterized protein n=1 Tax=Puccinia coronata f. sp. avenae TaxID=200324 RepID=A0A2N5TD82_9BASI|nr:hypothetical protein PCANC_27920 [Puccinia coronata f. sp. avenae]